MATEVRAAGIDVGGSKKGFHAAAVVGQSMAADPERLRDVAEVIAWVKAVRTTVIAIDSPQGTVVSHGEIVVPTKRSFG